MKGEIIYDRIYAKTRKKAMNKLLKMYPEYDISCFGVEEYHAILRYGGRLIFNHNRAVSVEITRKWHTAYIAFGSNMGNKKLFIDNGIRGLNKTKGCRIEAVSDYLVTEPYGVTDQDEFLNGVLKMRTLLSPEELLVRLHELEQEANRERIIHWGPRTLDLDILFYDQEIIDTADLHVPHPDMQNREFVLAPMNQIAPYLRHPVLNQTISQLLNTLLCR